jgi:hypothetical protein
LSHVGLQLVGIGAIWWLPARFFRFWAEVVREVLGVGNADFPALWKAGFGLTALVRRWFIFYLQ